MALAAGVSSRPTTLSPGARKQRAATPPRGHAGMAAPAGYPRQLLVFDRRLVGISVDSAKWNAYWATPGGADGDSHGLCHMLGATYTHYQAVTFGHSRSAWTTG